MVDILVTWRRLAGNILFLLVSITGLFFLLTDFRCNRGTPELTSAGNSDIFIENIAVIPMSGDTLLTEQDVWIQDGVITGLQPHQIHDNSTFDGMRINGTGKYLIPSLIDCHVHYATDKALYAYYDSLYLHYGVLVSMALNSNPGVLAHRDQIAAHSVVGPRLQVASPPLNDSTMTPNAARQLLVKFRDQGYQYVKL